MRSCQVVDRPLEPEAQSKFTAKTPNAVLIQPQWVYDAFNARVLLPVQPYAPVCSTTIAVLC